MMFAKVSFAALCCFMASATKLSAAHQDVPAAQSVAEERTMLQEMLIFSDLLNVSPFNRRDQSVEPTLFGDVRQKLVIQTMISELMVLKSMIDNEKDIFNFKMRTAPLPNYKGEKRYLCVKGLLNSMAQKFEHLKGFLSTTTAESDEFKQKLVDLKFGTKVDILDGLTLREIKNFYKIYYGENAPIPNLRHLFTLFEKIEVETPDHDKTHPFAAFINDSTETGVELSPLDQGNVKMQVVPDRTIMQTPTVDAGRSDVVEETVESTSDTQTQDTVQQNENVNTGESNVDSGLSQESQLLTEVTEETEEHKEREGQVGGLPAQQMAGVREPNGPPALPVEQKDASRASPTPAAIPSPTPSGSPSLRSGATETTTPKASSAFDSFVSLLLVASAVFIF